ncbi:MAG: NAD-dependent epimerase/dehydratase family protein, partial [Desulfobacterales bacterium]|nr:NAD-dependent epimerase/dehydratase family protein [Desulfobacterales bacterium]
DLGSAIVKRLVQRGCPVRSLSRRRYSQLEALGVEQVQGDLDDFSAVDQACSGMDTVFHVAAKAGVWGPWSAYFRTNVTGTENIVTACVKHGVSCLIYTSSPSVVFNGKDMAGIDETAPYPDTYHTHYPETKAMAEKIIRHAQVDGLKTIILRPHLIWGPGDNHLVPRIIARARRLVQVGNGQNLVDTIYIDNAADAHILAADALEAHPELSGSLYFISQGKPIRLWDMVNAILKAAGLPPVKHTLSHRTARMIGAIMETVYRKFHLPGEPLMTRFVADELATSHWFDISAAKKDLAYEPAVSTREGLDRLAVWLKNGR